uniref:Putative secreted protein n=1 Tax=Anopheles darlingi TaxID=43151 RepID=A0A2M4D9D7_ANODA
MISNFFIFCFLSVLSSNKHVHGGKSWDCNGISIKQGIAFSSLCEAIDYNADALPDGHFYGTAGDTFSPFERKARSPDDKPSEDVTAKHVCMCAEGGSLDLTARTPPTPDEDVMFPYLSGETR